MESYSKGTPKTSKRPSGKIRRNRLLIAPFIYSYENHFQMWFGYIFFLVASPFLFEIKLNTHFPKTDGSQVSIFYNFISSLYPVKMLIHWGSHCHFIFCITQMNDIIKSIKTRKHTEKGGRGWNQAFLLKNKHHSTFNMKLFQKKDQYSFYKKRNQAEKDFEWSEVGFYFVPFSLIHFPRDIINRPGFFLKQGDLLTLSFCVPVHKTLHDCIMMVSRWFIF